jgi:hypothetical protein
LDYLTTRQLECEKAGSYLIEMSALNSVTCDMLRRLSPAGSATTSATYLAAAPRAFLFTRPFLTTTKTIHSLLGIYGFPLTRVLLLT